VRIEAQGAPSLHVPVVPAREVADPTGGGDAFRAGFLGATSWGLSAERAAQVGAMIATLVLEVDGAQEYEIVPEEFAARIGATYGEDAAAEVRPHLA
jgi:adenosine kinase